MFVCQLLTSAKKAKQQRQNERCSIEHLSLSFSGLLNLNRKQESEPKKKNRSAKSFIYYYYFFKGKKKSIIYL